MTARLDPTEDVRAVTTEAELREIVDEPLPRIAEKAIPFVDAESRRFIGASPFLPARHDRRGRQSRRLPEGRPARQRRR
ncbi:MULTISPECIES: hypothetical protein [Actinoalloteichus]|uniref:Uncharacterized protein n=1 Tax=Actinoalloteichus fjordicus TaxID=1612552 RepID=A0AAC9PSZ9_9PSEU|nr:MULTISPECIES: hypothetical protein [Actinoalloteichus]APU15623.1 hypothetical protein UA74_17975 [Actinoalloteichus fjordicus]APU21683.1 hypothetical protein UA75_18465 [Actinoalloteichus sp. GBA129-24]